MRILSQYLVKTLMYLKFEGKHGHYVVKGDKKLKKRRNTSLRIAESLWKIAKESYFTFCSIVLSPDGKYQISSKKKLEHRRVTPQSSMLLLENSMN